MICFNLWWHEAILFLIQSLTALLCCVETELLLCLKIFISMEISAKLTMISHSKSQAKHQQQASSGKVENQDGPKVSSIIPSLPKDHQELWEFDMFSRLANRSQVRYTRYLEKLKGTTKPKSSQFSPHPHELPTFLLATIEIKRCKYWYWL